MRSAKDRVEEKGSQSILRARSDSLSWTNSFNIGIVAHWRASVKEGEAKAQMWSRWLAVFLRKNEQTFQVESKRATTA